MPDDAAADDGPSGEVRRRRGPPELALAIGMRWEMSLTLKSGYTKAGLWELTALQDGDEPQSAFYVCHL